MVASSGEESELCNLLGQVLERLSRNHFNLRLKSAALALNVEVQHLVDLNFNAPAVLESKFLQGAHFTDELSAGLERRGFLGLARLWLFGGVEEKAAHAVVGQSHLFKYRAFDLLESVLRWHRHEPIKRSFTLIIKADQRNIFAFLRLCLLLLVWSVLVFLVLFFCFFMFRLLQELSLTPKDNFLFDGLGLASILGLLVILAGLMME